MDKTVLNPKYLLLGIIWLYRKAVSPWMFPCCRFTPSCSEYAQDALRTHGLFIGILLSAWRLIRCNPFCKGGHDPVPPAGHPVFRGCGSCHTNNDLEKVLR